MKLGGRDARAFLRRPDPSVAAVLISGEDGGRVAEARAGLLLALLGPEAEAEMRLDRIAGAEARREGALLLDALKARGFFPGPRAVWLEDATDGLAGAVEAALDSWAPGDATLVATAGGLTARSALRKLFEGRRGAAAITLYDDPPTEGEVLERLRAAGLGAVEEAARGELLVLAQSLGPGEFGQLLERLALHQMGAAGPLEAAVVAALAPQGEGADLDDLLAALGDGKRAAVPPLLARLAAQGTGPVAIALQALRHFRAILLVASDPGGPQAGLGRLRPPPGGPRRQALARAAAGWPRGRIEVALRRLLALDLQLRSSTRAPDRAVLEDALLKVAALREGGRGAP